MLRLLKLSVFIMLTQVISHSGFRGRGLPNLKGAWKSTLLNNGGLCVVWTLTITHWPSLVDNSGLIVELPTILREKDTEKEVDQSGFAFAAAPDRKTTSGNAPSMICLHIPAQVPTRILAYHVGLLQPFVRMAFWDSYALLHYCITEIVRSR